MPDHWSVDGRTQHMSLSAPVAKVRCQKRSEGPSGIVLLSEDTSKSYAELGEVSPILVATPPARPATCQTAFGRAQAPYPLP